MRIPSQRRKATWRQPVGKVRYTFPIYGATEEHLFTGCRPLQPELCSEMDLAVLENASLVGLEQVQARPARLVAGLWFPVAEVEVERLAESLNAWDATTAVHNAERLDRIATRR